MTVGIWTYFITWIVEKNEQIIRVVKSTQLVGINQSVEQTKWCIPEYDQAIIFVQTPIWWMIFFLEKNSLLLDFSIFFMRMFLMALKTETIYSGLVYLVPDLIPSLLGQFATRDSWSLIVVWETRSKMSLTKLLMIEHQFIFSYE